MTRQLTLRQHWCNVIFVLIVCLVFNVVISQFLLNLLIHSETLNLPLPWVYIFIHLIGWSYFDSYTTTLAAFYLVPFFQLHLRRCWLFFPSQGSDRRCDERAHRLQMGAWCPDDIGAGVHWYQVRAAWVYNNWSGGRYPKLKFQRWSSEIYPNITSHTNVWLIILEPEQFTSVVPTLNNDLPNIRNCFSD